MISETVQWIAGAGFAIWMLANFVNVAIKIKDGKNRNPEKQPSLMDSSSARTALMEMHDVHLMQTEIKTAMNLATEVHYKQSNQLSNLIEETKKQTRILEKIAKNGEK